MREPETMVREAMAAVHEVVVGFGPVGQTVTRILKEFEIRPVIIDLNVDTVNRLVDEGQPAIYGDAARDAILRRAGIEEAAYLIITLPGLANRMPVIVAAREMNPELKILVRARYLAERAMLEEMGATVIVYEEAEAAVALAESLLGMVGAPAERVGQEAERIRKEFEVRRWQALLEEPPGPPTGPSGV